MDKTIRTIIVEDEMLARQLLHSFLKDCPDVDIVGECANAFEGIEMINELKPDLVLLDIQMPKLTGLEMLEMLTYKPRVIFTTAYDEFAIKAFELSAVDYLLKPFSKQRLFEAVEKLKERGWDVNNQEIDKLGSQLNGKVVERLVVKDRQRISIIPLHQIVRIEAMDDYVIIITEEGRYIKQITMKALEEQLSPSSFVRVHRSHIVNVAQIERVDTKDKDGFKLTLLNEEQVKVSRTGYKKLKTLLAL